MRPSPFVLAPAFLLLSSAAGAQQPPAPQPYGGLAPPTSGPPTATNAPPANNGSWQQPQPQPNAQNNWQQPQPQNGASRTDTERALREAEEKDSGRGLEWFALQPEVGLQQVGLTTFSGSDSGTFKSSGVGPLVGALANVRLLFVTIGVRGRYAMLSDFKLWSITPEVGFHMPIGNLEPYAFVGAGYAALAGLPDVPGGSVSVHGFDVRLGIGLDYYLSRQFSVGGVVTSEILPMKASVSVGGASADSSSTGFANALSLVLGVHL